MGAQLEGKDPHIEICLTLGKSLYFAGEVV
jgi:hypothetical protein